jgi:hypothetical protein
MSRYSSIAHDAKTHFDNLSIYILQQSFLYDGAANIMFHYSKIIWIVACKLSQQFLWAFPGVKYFLG